MRLKHLLILILYLGSNMSIAQKESPVSKTDTLVVGYNINPPFVYENNDRLDGISYRLWEKITKDDQTAYKLEYHPLDSLITGLSNNTIDIAISPLTITSEREETIDFSFPYYVSYATVMVKKLTFKQRIREFFTSISIWNLLKVLGALLALLAVFGTLVWVFEYKQNEQFSGGLKGFWSGLWWSAVTMTTVGYGDKSPKTIGGRVVGLIWMFSAIILISSITAGITSSLTIKRLEWANEDLSYFTEISIGTVKNSATEERLLDNYYNNIKSYHTFNELLDALKQNDIDAIAYDEPLLHYTLHHNEDFKDFELLNISFNQSLYAMAFSKQLNVQKKEMLSRKILAHTESNDWKILLSKYKLIDKQYLILDTK